MPFGAEVGLFPGQIVLNGDQLPNKKGAQQPPIFGPCLLWPNGWMDQDETWHGTGSRPWPWPHCVSWGPSSPPPKGHSPQFSAHFCCGQTARWIKVPLGREIGLGPGDIVLDRDPAPPPQRGTAPPPIFGPCLLWPNGWMGSGGLKEPCIG